MVELCATNKAKRRVRTACLVLVQNAGSVDVEVAKRRVARSEITELIVGEGDANVAPVLVLWRQVARSTTHVDVSSLDHTVRQLIVDLVATAIKSRLHAVTDERLSPEPFDFLHHWFNHIITRITMNGSTITGLKQTVN